MRSFWCLFQKEVTPLSRGEPVGISMQSETGARVFSTSQSSFGAGGEAAGEALPRVAGPGDVEAERCSARRPLPPPPCNSRLWISGQGRAGRG